MNAPLSVGSKLWKFDSNRRAYTKPAPGRLYGSIIFSEHFIEKEIVGESKTHWIVATPGTKRTAVTRVADMPFNYHAVKKAIVDDRSDYYTDDGKAQKIWGHDHRGPLLRKLERLTDVELRAVAKSLGWPEAS